jgi:hypothetical protein
MNCSSRECPVMCSNNEDSSECCRICTGKFNFSVQALRRESFTLRLIAVPLWSRSIADVMRFHDPLTAPFKHPVRT